MSSLPSQRWPLNLELARRMAAQRLQLNVFTYGNLIRTLGPVQAWPRVVALLHGPLTVVSRASLATAFPKQAWRVSLHLEVVPERWRWALRCGPHLDEVAYATVLPSCSWRMSLAILRTLSLKQRSLSQNSMNATRALRGPGVLRMAQGCQRSRNYIGPEPRPESLPAPGRWLGDGAFYCWISHIGGLDPMP